MKDDPRSPLVAFGLAALKETMAVKLGRARAADAAARLQELRAELLPERPEIDEALLTLGTAADETHREAAEAADAFLVALETGGLSDLLNRRAQAEAALAAAGLAQWQRRADLA